MRDTAIKNEPIVHESAASQEFALLQRKGQSLAASTLIPKDYQKNLPNCLIAMEIADRIGMSVLQVMQNLYIVHGRPSWSSQFIIAALNSCGRFAPLKFKIDDGGEKEVEYSWYEGPKDARQKKTGRIKIRNKICTPYTHDKSGELLEGPAVSIEMAVQEGWYTKNDSKWKTMPDLMLRYRAAAFFGRLYAPEILMGMHAEDEIIDAGLGTVKDVTPTSNVFREIETLIKDEKAVEPEAPQENEEDLSPSQAKFKEIVDAMGTAKNEAELKTILLANKAHIDFLDDDMKAAINQAEENNLKRFRKEK